MQKNLTTSEDGSVTIGPVHSAPRSQAAPTADMWRSGEARVASESLCAEAVLSPDADAADRAAEACCFHCGASCRDGVTAAHQKVFCCRGCLTVYELLAENGLTDFYKLDENAGVRVRPATGRPRFQYLDEPKVRERLIDFTDDRVTRVTFRIPTIHCIACVWLLENLFRLNPGIGRSQVNFPRKEVAISFENCRVQLSEVAGLLASLGYEPELQLADLENRRTDRTIRRLWLQLGVAGFAFGNIMLFSLSTYFGLDSLNGLTFGKVFGYLSLALSIPVLVFSAADYWRSAWAGVRQRMLTIDIPIAAGLAALFAQSAYEVVAGRGEGYFDSLSGLVFFLLCGKVFQRKSYDRIAFDRDYKSFFPLSIIRKKGRIEDRVSLSQLAVGDRLVLRNGELLPADARLLEGPALVDYSFVTGESEPVEKTAGDHLYAGGRQMGGAIEVETVKPVSESYLTSLWNQEAFRKEKMASLVTLTNRYSVRFTKIVVAVALTAAVFWLFRDPDRSLKAFTSVLIVACPCALALAAPFALGTAQRLLARHGVFLKNPGVLEVLARVNAAVFDKTGTLTVMGTGSAIFEGAPLTEAEERWLFSMTRHSTHPYAVRLSESIGRNHFPEPVRSFLETTGCGMEGRVMGHEIWMGSAAWLESRGEGGRCPSEVVSSSRHSGSSVHVAIDGKYRGCFVLANALRPNAQPLIDGMAGNCDLALLSGDNDRERGKFRRLFGARAELHFKQRPLDKLHFVRRLQESGKTVMMVGDGLNDAGALRQSDVGVAVVENISGFSPASDVILSAKMLPRLYDVIRYSRAAASVVQWSFVISSVYNVVGISIAACGLLSPVICAILMPLSSVTVVAFACGATTWLACRAGFAARTVAEAGE